MQGSGLLQARIELVAALRETGCGELPCTFTCFVCFRMTEMTELNINGVAFKCTPEIAKILFSDEVGKHVHFDAPFKQILYRIKRYLLSTCCIARCSISYSKQVFSV